MKAYLLISISVLGLIAAWIGNDAKYFALSVICSLGGFIVAELVKKLRRWVEEE